MGWWLALPEPWLAIITVLEIIWVLVSSTYIILERRSAHATLAWILTFTLLPLVGFFIYLFLGPRRFDRRKRRRGRARAEVRRRESGGSDGGCSIAPPGMAATVSLVEGAVGDAGRLRAGNVSLLPTGEAKFLALLQAFREATVCILLEYYIWEPDSIGTRLRDALVEKAKAGVTVRVLVDGLGSASAGSSFWRPLRKAGGDVRHFNGGSFWTWKPSMTNFRSHRKIAIIDGRLGFTGGMNITDSHSAEFHGDEAWRDMHLRIHGAPVLGLAQVFYEDWCYAGGSLEGVTRSDEVSSQDIEGTIDFTDVPMQIVSSGPDDGVDAIHKLFFSTISAARERVLLTTPYFVPDEAITQALSVAAMRGVHVEILVPAEGDQPVVAAAARSYYPELVNAGVKIYELRNPVLHAKTLVVDGMGIVGTANMDNRSFRLNFEVVVALYSEDVANALAEIFETDTRAAERIDLERLAALPFNRRLLSAAARLFSPIL